MPSPNSPNQLLRQVHATALAYPDAYEEEPWGHPAIKVRKKAFLFCSTLDAEAPTLSVKLPASAAEARERPGVEPTGYGLGRHGWCSVRISGEIGLEQLLWTSPTARSRRRPW